MNLKIIPRISLAAFLATTALTAMAQSTAFTYQGRLLDGGAPADGIYDLQFTLYNSTTNPIVGGINGGVVVSNGLFTTQLDLGNAFVNGSARWLGIAVRTNGGGPFTPLTNLQAITSSPYAIQSLAASSVASSNINGSLTLTQLPAVLITNGSGAVNLSGTFSGSGSGLTNFPANVALLSATQTFTGIQTFTNRTVFSGSVGMGTPTPDRPLAIKGSGLNGEWISFADSTNGVTRWHLNNTVGGLNFVQSGVADFRLFLSTNGNVGIGVSVPQSKLQVSGNVQLGPNGVNYAASGHENLRIVRGTVQDNGTSVISFAGSDYTVQHTGVGAYTINFNTPFGGNPSFTATGYSSIVRADTISTITTSSVKLSVIGTSGAPMNDSFSFIAIGPAN